MTKQLLSVLIMVAATACGGSAEESSAIPAEQTAPAPTSGDEAVEADTGPTAEELTALASEAWIYGYPHIYHIDEMLHSTGTDELATAAPLNLTGSATRLANADDEFVSVNNDTIYHTLMGDVGDEPLVLNVPATGDRYFLLQFIDAWTNNFAYLGTRGTEGRAGKYLLAGPGWAGEVPEGLTLLRIPTRLFAIIGRIAVNGERDLRAARRIQENTWVTPLSVYPEQATREGREFGDRDFAPYDHEVPEELVFWEKLRSWMALCPPPAAETDYIARFEPLGLLTPGAESPYRDASPELQGALIAGLEAAKAHLEASLTAGSASAVNGWTLTTHLFDYNLDYFEVGTIDSDEWKIADRSAAFAARAFAARAGLWGNHGYEAVYAMTNVDGDGERLTGEHRYEIRFETPPPVGAFWSITMYDHPNYFLVANDTNRYALGSLTRGLRTARDGSVTISISREAPPRAQRANWLPAPEGPFRPAMRMYLPEAAITDGTYELPAIRRVDTEESASE